MTEGAGHKQTRFWLLTLISLFGPAVWTLHLGLVYGVQHVACAISASAESRLFVFLFTSAATVCAMLALAVVGLRPKSLRNLVGRARTRPETASFLAEACRLLCLLSFFGVLWAGSAALFVSECPAWR